MRSGHTQKFKRIRVGEVSMANCYFAKPHGVQHCYIPFLYVIDFKGALNFGEAPVHVSLMEVTPTSGKGTLGTWWFLRQARAWLDKTEHINRSQGQGRSYEQTIRRRGVCAPALEPQDEGEGSWTKCQGFKPDL